MLVSYNWLKQYISLPVKLTPEELALKLTMSTVEVEGVINQGKNLENIVVGEIKKIDKHPNADKLKLVEVNIGKETVRAVCGGSNLKEGMKVALAKIGARVKWHGEGDLVELQKTKIRGKESSGMICAADEIGLGGMFPKKSESEILDISQIKNQKSKIKNQNIVGTPLVAVLGLDDVIFEIDNKSITHRPDLWGHYGLAREVGALYGTKISDYEPPKIKKQVTRNKKQTSPNLKVDIRDKDLCLRYMAVMIDGVKICPSPDWMQKKLLAVGLRPINNIVDITNFLLYDLGQPMHAFDAEQLERKVERGKWKGEEIDIIVRRAEKGEKFMTLDEKERKLNDEMLVIADKKRAVALAGIIGGKNSGVSEKTTTIIYESANFDATNIRRTATALGVRTDSSARFEKSLDPNNAELALRRAVQLTLEICPEARVVSNVADEYHSPFNQRLIELSLEFLRKKIGTEIAKEKVVEILQSLGFGIEDRKERMVVKVPSWRATKDISIPEDLVEEVARIYGYGDIEVSLPVFPVIPPKRNELRMLERKIKQSLALEFGFTENYNYSFVSPQLLQKLDINLDKYIELDNPIDKTRPYLRRSLLPNLLENAEKSLHSFDEVKLFEIGKVFIIEEPGEKADKNSDELLPRQDSVLGLVYAKKDDKVPFYAVSSSLMSMLERLGFEAVLEKVKDIASHLHPGRQARLRLGYNGQAIGLVGELHPANQKNMGIEARVAVGTIDLNKLLELFKEKSGYQPIPNYPAVARDIAFVVDKDIGHAKLVEAIKKADKLIVEVELFDVFESDKLGAGKKSMAYHIVYQAIDRTLEAGEVDGVHAKVERMLEKDFKASLRK